MGFDLAITCTLHMCPETGKPFYYGSDPENRRIIKVYELPQLEVSEELRPYLQLRGHHLHAYIEEWDKDNIFQTDTGAFLENYMSWEEFKTNRYTEDEVEDYWTEKDHNNLRRLLEWCSGQSISFQIYWSY